MFISVINILLLVMMALFYPQAGYSQQKIVTPIKAIKKDGKVSLKTQLPPFKRKAPAKKAKTNLDSGLPPAPNQGAINLTSPPKKQRGNFKHPKKDSLHGPLNPRKRIPWSSVTNGNNKGRKLRKTKASPKGATKTINQQPLPPKATSKQMEININSNTTKKDSKKAKKQ